MIGIYGGTFDPVHYGHLRPALDVKQGLGLEQVRFIPCGQPPHRQQPLATASQRLAMLHLVLDQYPDLIVDDCEITRPGPSYMIDTLVDLKTRMPGEGMCLIVGMDAFVGFDSWKEWASILDTVNLVVTHRPNYKFGDDQVSDALKSEVISRSAKTTSDLVKHDRGKILFFPVIQLDISSTLLRENIKLGKDNRFLLPDEVITYIRQEKIYS